MFLIQELQIALPQKLEDIKLPAPEMVNYWRLAENRIFYIDYEIDILLKYNSLQDKSSSLFQLIP